MNILEKFFMLIQKSKMKDVKNIVKKKKHL
jgi:hypothetical protein